MGFSVIAITCLDRVSIRDRYDLRPCVKRLRGARLQPRCQTPYQLSSRALRELSLSKRGGVEGSGVCHRAAPEGARIHFACLPRAHALGYFPWAVPPEWPDPEFAWGRPYGRQFPGVVGGRRKAGTSTRHAAGVR